MRRFLVPLAFLLLPGCATQQANAPTPAQQPLPSQYTRGRITGLTAEELVQKFGTPALQIREGDSWKLQFRSRQCVLDAYLYPPAPGRTNYRTTYVETRTPSLESIDQGLCIASFPAP